MARNIFHTTYPPIRNLNIRKHWAPARTNGEPVHVLDHSSLRVDATSFAKVSLIKVAITAKACGVWGGYSGIVCDYRYITDRLCAIDSCTGVSY